MSQPIKRGAHAKRTAVQYVSTGTELSRASSRRPRKNFLTSSTRNWGLLDRRSCLEGDDMSSRVRRRASVSSSLHPIAHGFVPIGGIPASIDRPVVPAAGILIPIARTRHSASCTSNSAQRHLSSDRSHGISDRWHPYLRSVAGLLPIAAPHMSGQSLTTQTVPARRRNNRRPRSPASTRHRPPAVRRPGSKTISAGTRESEHPRMMANGSWPAATS